MTGAFAQRPADVLATIGRNNQFTGTPVIAKGSHIVQAGYGFPNKLAQYLDFGGIADIFSGSGSSKSSFGPLGLNYEYMLDDQFGIGASAQYSWASQTYDLRIPIIDTRIGGITGTIHQVQLGVHGTYHFFTTDKFDGYARAGVGLNLWSGEYRNDNNEDVKEMEFPTPYTYQGLAGIRYFISPNMGLYVEGNLNNINSFVNFGLVTAF